MLDGGTFWSSTGIASNTSFFTFFKVFNFLFLTLLEAKPFLRSIVQPRVQVSNALSFNLLVWAFLWPEFVQEVVFLFLAKNVKRSFKVFFNDFINYLIFLLQFSVTLHFSLILETLKAPKTKITKDWS